MALSLILASCGEAVEEEEEEEIVGEDWWDKLGEPEYGGTITIRAASDFTCFDGYYFKGGDCLVGLYLSPLTRHDWALDRKYGSLRRPIIPLSSMLAILWKAGR